MDSRRLLLAALGALQGRLLQAAPAPAPPLPGGTPFPGAPSPTIGGVPIPAPAPPPTPAPLPSGVTVGATLGPVYPDVADAACTVGMRCSSNVAGIQVPVNRGLCVQTLSGKQCWDACNTTHLPTSYITSPRETQQAIALMIKQLRTGVRTGSCPGAKMPTGLCNPDERCTPPGLTYLRGMCVTSPPPAVGNTCLDMCNTKIPISTYKARGAQKTTIDLVEQVRAGQDPLGRTTCPGPSVWTWLWFPILLCCCVGFCALSYYLFNYYRRSLKPGMKRGGGVYPEPEATPFVQDQEPYSQYQQDYPQEYNQQALPSYEQVVETPYGPEIVAEPVAELPLAEEKALLLEEPMAVPPLEPLAPVTTAPLFSGLGGLQPATLTQPGTFATPMTTGFPMAGSMNTGMAGGALQSGFQSRPMYTSSMTTGMAPYGAYGTYPGGATTSMRIG